MSNVYWLNEIGERVTLPDGTESEVRWHDLIDTRDAPRHWRVTYRDDDANWFVMYSSQKVEEEYIPKDSMSEQQLREMLRYKYLLLRGSHE
jgi:hypothetical protein